MTVGCKHSFVEQILTCCRVQVPQLSLAIREMQVKRFSCAKSWELFQPTQILDLFQLATQWVYCGPSNAQGLLTTREVS